MAAKRLKRRPKRRFRLRYRVEKILNRLTNAKAFSTLIRMLDNSAFSFLSALVSGFNLVDFKGVNELYSND
jgi:hypothetical protein